MQFKIDQEIFSRAPDYKVGIIVAKLHDIADPNLIDDYMQRAATSLNSNWRNSSRVTGWQQTFSTFNLNADETKPAHIALLERVEKNGVLPNVLPLVNLTNSISILNQVPLGSHCLDTLTEDIVVRLTKPDDTFTAMNTSAIENVESGKPAYTSGTKILTKNLVWRQGETSKITEHSQTVLIPIDVLESTSETQLQDMVVDVLSALKEVFNAEIVVAGITTAAIPSISWDTKAVRTEEQNKTLHTLNRGVETILPSTDSLAKLMSEKKMRVYLGIDPTGSLLTLGHSVVLRKLQQFAELGHDVILLIGNGTVKIGDPTGKDSTRPELTDEVIEENFKTWKEQASKVLDFSKIKVVHNGDWLDKLTYSDMLKLMAKTTIQQLMERDMFQKRLQEGKPVHGHEIMYPLLQGYDSVEMDVDLEIGGSDQLFNMMMGRHLQKEYNNREKWVLTTPLINGTDGRKMSKSYGNFVALTENPIDMYGKLMRVADSEIMTYFTVLTDISDDSISSMQNAIDTGENPMQFKKRLAFEITRMYHDEAAAIQAEEFFERTIQNNQIPEDIPPISVIDSRLSVIDLLKIALPNESASNLRRLIEQGAVELLPSSEKPTDPYQIIDTANVEVIRVGKRRYFRITNSTTNS